MHPAYEGKPASLRYDLASDNPCASGLVSSTGGQKHVPT